jgi:ketosteroid isomerase-like protein
MSMHHHATPHETEDALYDALDDGDLEALMGVWDDADDITCLLPMQALAKGREAVRAAYEPLLSQGRKVAISVTHVLWYETDTLAVHLVEERAEAHAGQQPAAIYATNVYRHGPHGWRLLAHLNAPTPPPPEMMAPLGRRP